MKLQMDTTRYGLRAVTPLPMVAAEMQVREALTSQGFDVVSEIDVAETLRLKLGVERDPYRILGACNPQFTAQALDVEPDVGLLLPCNVVLYEDTRGTVVAALDPSTIAHLTGNPVLEPIVKEARVRLERVVATLAARC